MANYVPEDVQVMFHSENGLIGVGKKPAPGQANPHITNAGGIPWILLRALRLLTA